MRIVASKTATTLISVDWDEAVHANPRTNQLETWVRYYVWRLNAQREDHSEGLHT
jgi:hypothetical protein